MRTPRRIRPLIGAALAATMIGSISSPAFGASDRGTLGVSAVVVQSCSIQTGSTKPEMACTRETAPRISTERTQLKTAPTMDKAVVSAEVTLVTLTF